MSRQKIRDIEKEIRKLQKDINVVDRRTYMPIDVYGISEAPYHI